eukprot:gene12932-7513_t
MFNSYLRQLENNKPETRIRYEIHDNSQEAKENLKKYFAAVQMFTKSTILMSVLGIHGFPFAWCHKDPNVFLPFHRFYTFFYENALRSLLPEFSNVTVPFWNYQKKTEIPEIYKHLKGRDATGKPVTRAAVFNQTRAESSIFTYENYVKHLTNITDYQNKMENNPHNAIHASIGGHMTRISLAAFDPVFFAHHVQVDRLWHLWNVDKGINADKLSRIGFKNLMKTKLVFYSPEDKQVEFPNNQRLEISRYSENNESILFEDVLNDDKHGYSIFNVNISYKEDSTNENVKKKVFGKEYSLIEVIHKKTFATYEVLIYSNSVEIGVVFIVGMGHNSGKKNFHHTISDTVTTTEILVPFSIFNLQNLEYRCKKTELKNEDQLHNENVKDIIIKVQIKPFVN